MWRLVAFILICAFFLVFIVFNLENKSDISFGFKVYEDIPVFLTAFSSFVLGMLFAAPFALSLGKKRGKQSHSQAPVSHEPPPLSAESQAGAPKKWWSFKKKNNTANVNKIEGNIASPTDEVKKERSPYGID